MSSIQLDSVQFNTRCSKISEKLDCPVLVLLGKSSDVEVFNMNSALFHYLVGYEFPETIIVIQEQPIVITSPKKAIFFQQIEGIKIVIKNKDDSNLDSIISSLQDIYGVVDGENSKGELCSRVLRLCRTRDVTAEILELMTIKEREELDLVMKSGLASNHLIQRGIDLIRDEEFSREELESCMNERIRGVNSNAIEFSFNPESSSDHLRIGVRYRGYCTEVARPFFQDLSDEYEIQKHVLGLVRPGVSSSLVLDGVKSFLSDKGYSHKVELYTLGLMEKELDFERGFEIQNSMVFCLNIDNRFCNTFLINDLPIFVTKRDSKEDYSANRMRFRNKSNDVALAAKIKEHQSELLDGLIEERIAYYSTHKPSTLGEKKESRCVLQYEKDSFVPRSDKILLDWDKFYVIVPVLSYSVPFHISTIKNVSIVLYGEESRLRINFKESKEIREIIEGKYDTKLKFLTARSSDADEILMQINEMKREFAKPSIEVKEQPVLKERFKKFALTDLYMRTDNRATNKKMLGSLELHENGFRYNDIQILFSNIKNALYQAADFDNRAILHLHLKEPIMHVKPTCNIQFFRKFSTSYQDTSKRENEHLEMIQEKEEEEEVIRTNAEFLGFIERVEQETSIRFQTLEREFLGVHSKEAVLFYITNECLVSLNELPFFILNFDEVEVASFERVTFSTKTFDCVFVFKDKTKVPVTIGSIDTTKLSFMKELLDSHNIIFMETKVNINWGNLIQTIMKDPLSFYENGAWSELLREEDETESESESSISEETVSSYEDDETTSYDNSGESSEYSSEDGSRDSLVSKDSEYDSEDSNSSYDSEEPKKRKTGK